MVRTQVQLTESQARTLRRIARREGVSMSEMVRRAVDQVVVSERMGNRDEIKKRAIAAIGRGHSGIGDLSARHDEYLARSYSE